MFDGRDRAAWAVFEMENRLEAAAEAVQTNADRYPIPLPYGVALAPKGAGFYGEGTNPAHNFPLPSNPHTDPVAAHLFNDSARRLWVPSAELQEAVGRFQHHDASNRPRKRDHPLTHRALSLRDIPPLALRPVPQDRRDAAQWSRASPMFAVVATCIALV